MYHPTRESCASEAHNTHTHTTAYGQLQEYSMTKQNQLEMNGIISIIKCTTDVLICNPEAAFGALQRLRPAIRKIYRKKGDHKNLKSNSPTLVISNDPFTLWNVYDLSVSTLWPSFIQLTVLGADDNGHLRVTVLLAVVDMSHSATMLTTYHTINFSHVHKSHTSMAYNDSLMKLCNVCIGPLYYIQK